MIKLNNITKIFTLPDKKLTALDNVSLHVPKGQICGVIGASGAGKSTLIRCVNLLERPTHGAVVIDDVDLTQLSDAELVKTRRQIGMIFQHFNLLTSRTVFENVALPLELENKSKAEIQEKTTALLADGSGAIDLDNVQCDVNLTLRSTNEKYKKLALPIRFFDSCYSPQYKVNIDQNFRHQLKELIKEKLK